MSALSGHLQGYKNLVQAKNDLERLKFLPQQLKDGELINFKGESTYGVIETLKDGDDFEVIDAERVNGASRFTSALQKEYFEGFDKLMDIIVKADGGTTTTKTDDPKEPTIEDKILDIVEAGDKKAFRALRKDIKEAWFALGNDEVGDALLDLADAVADKDLEFANEILDGLCEDDPAYSKPNEVREDVEATLKTEEGVDEQPAPKEEPAEDDDELYADFNDAVTDEDEEDAELCLKEMKETKHPKLKECEKTFNDKFGAAKSKDEPAEEEGDIVDEILDDLDDALDKKDLDECQKLIGELSAEVDEDDPDLKDYQSKVAELAKELTPADDKPARRRRRNRG